MQRRLEGKLQNPEGAGRNRDPPGCQLAVQGLIRMPGKTPQDPSQSRTTPRSTLPDLADAANHVFMPPFCSSVICSSAWWAFWADNSTVSGRAKCQMHFGACSCARMWLGDRRLASEASATYACKSLPWHDFVAVDVQVVQRY